MSVKNVKKFLNLAKSNKKLQKELIVINEKMQKAEGNEEKFIADNIVPLAKKNGVTFTAKDFLKYADEQMSTLSEEDLLNVSGGISARNTAAALLVTFLGSLGVGAAVNLLNLSQEDGQSVVRKAEKNSGEDSRNNQDEVDPDVQNAVNKMMSDLDQKKDADEKNNNESEAESVENVAKNDNEASKKSEAEQKNRREAMQNKDVVLPNSNAKSTPAVPQINVAPLQANTAKASTKSSVPTVVPGVTGSGKHAENVGGYGPAVADSKNKPLTVDEANYLVKKLRSRENLKLDKNKDKKVYNLLARFTRTNTEVFAEYSNGTVFSFEGQPFDKKLKGGISAGVRKTGERLVTPFENESLLLQMAAHENFGHIIYPKKDATTNSKKADTAKPEIKTTVKAAASNDKTAKPETKAADKPATKLADKSAGTTAKKDETKKAVQPTEESKESIKVVASGKLGENAKWTNYEDDMTIISGTGVVNLDDANEDSLQKLKNGTKILIIEEGITSFGNCYFPNLASMYIPASLEDGVDSIRVGYDLESINVNKNNKIFKSIDGVLFSKDGTELICYPNAKTNTSYNIPHGVTSIGKTAFCNARYLQLIVSEGITAAQNSAFIGGGLSSISLPSSIISIGDYAFAGCNSLKAVIFRGDNEPTLRENIFGKNNPENIFVSNNYNGETFGGIAVTKVDDLDAKMAELSNTGGTGEEEHAENVGGRIIDYATWNFWFWNNTATNQANHIINFLNSLPRTQDGLPDLRYVSSATRARLEMDIIHLAKQLRLDPHNEEEITLQGEIDPVQKIARENADMLLTLANNILRSPQRVTPALVLEALKDNILPSDETQGLPDLDASDAIISDSLKAALYVLSDDQVNSKDNVISEKDRNMLLTLKQMVASEVERDTFEEEFDKVTNEHREETQSEFIKNEEIDDDDRIDDDEDIGQEEEADFVDNVGGKENNLEAFKQVLEKIGAKSGDQKYERFDFENGSDTMELAEHILNYLAKFENLDAESQRGLMLDVTALFEIREDKDDEIYKTGLLFKDLNEENFINERIRLIGIEINQLDEKAENMNDSYLEMSKQKQEGKKGKELYEKYKQKLEKKVEKEKEKAYWQETLDKIKKIKKADYLKEENNHSKLWKFYSEKVEPNYENIVKPTNDFEKLLALRDHKFSDPNNFVKKIGKYVNNFNNLSPRAQELLLWYLDDFFYTNTSFVYNKETKTDEIWLRADYDKETKAIVEKMIEIGIKNDIINQGEEKEVGNYKFSKMDYVKAFGATLVFAGAVGVYSAMLNLPTWVDYFFPAQPKKVHDPRQEITTEDKLLADAGTTLINAKNKVTSTATEVAEKVKKDLSSYGKVLKSSGEKVGKAAKNVINEGQASLKNLFKGKTTENVNQNVDQVDTGVNVTQIDTGISPANAQHLDPFGKTPATNLNVDAYKSDIPSGNSTMSTDATGDYIRYTLQDHQAKNNKSEGFWNKFFGGSNSKPTVKSSESIDQVNVGVQSTNITSTVTPMPNPTPEAHPLKSIADGSTNKGGWLSSGLDYLRSMLGRGGTPKSTPQAETITQPGKSTSTALANVNIPDSPANIEKLAKSTALANVNIPDSSANIEKLAKSTALVDPNGKPAAENKINISVPTGTEGVTRRATSDEINNAFLRKIGRNAEKSTINEAGAPKASEVPQSTALVDPNNKPPVASPIKREQPTSTPDVNRKITADEIGATFLRDNGGIAEKAKGKNWASTPKTPAGVPEAGVPESTRQVNTVGSALGTPKSTTQAETITQPGKSKSTEVAAFEGGPPKAETPKNIGENNGNLEQKIYRNSFNDINNMVSPVYAEQKDLDSENLANAENIFKEYEVSATVTGTTSADKTNFDAQGKTKADLPPNQKEVLRQLDSLPNNMPKTYESGVTSVNELPLTPEQVQQMIDETVPTTEEINTNKGKGLNIPRLDTPFKVNSNRDPAEGAIALAPPGGLGDSDTNATNSIGTFTEKSNMFSRSQFFAETGNNNLPKSKPSPKPDSTPTSLPKGSNEGVGSGEKTERSKNLAEAGASLAGMGIAAIAAIAARAARAARAYFGGGGPDGNHPGGPGGFHPGGGNPPGGPPADPGDSSSGSGYDDYSTGEESPVDVKNLIDDLNKLPKIDINGIELPDLTAVNEDDVEDLKYKIYLAGENISSKDYSLIEKNKFTSKDKVSREGLKMLKLLNDFLVLSTPKWLVENLNDKEFPKENGLPDLEGKNVLFKVGVAKIAARVRTENRGRGEKLYISKDIWDYDDYDMKSSGSVIMNEELSQENIQMILSTRDKYNLNVEDFITKVMTAEEIPAFAEQLRAIKLDEFWNRIYDENGNILEEGKEEHDKLANFREYCNIAKDKVTWQGVSLSEEDLKTFVDYGNVIFVWEYFAEGDSIKCAIFKESAQKFFTKFGIEKLKACVEELEEKIKEGFFDGFLNPFKAQAKKFLKDGKQLIADEEKKSAAAAKPVPEPAAEVGGGEAPALVAKLNTEKKLEPAEPAPAPEPAPAGDLGGMTPSAEPVPDAEGEKEPAPAGEGGEEASAPAQPKSKNKRARRKKKGNNDNTNKSSNVQTQPDEDLDDDADAGVDVAPKPAKTTAQSAPSLTYAEANDLVNFLQARSDLRLDQRRNAGQLALLERFVRTNLVELRRNDRNPVFSFEGTSFDKKLRDVSTKAHRSKTGSQLLQDAARINFLNLINAKK